MAKRNSGIGDVFRNMDRFQRREEEAATNGGELTAIQMASYAKTNRNWKDRTNLARNGLTGSSETRGTTVRVAIAHSPFYGVYLELANAGRYAIIEPTARAHRQKFLENVRRLGKV